MEEDLCVLLQGLGRQGLEGLAHLLPSLLVGRKLVLEGGPLLLQRGFQDGHLPAKFAQSFAQPLPFPPLLLQIPFQGGDSPDFLGEGGPLFRFTE